MRSSSILNPFLLALASLSCLNFNGKRTRRLIKTNFELDEF